MEDVDDDLAGRPAVPSGTSLTGLVGHLADAETTWVLRRFAGMDVSLPSETTDGTLAAAVAAYRATWGRVDAVAFGAASLDDRCRRPEPLPPVNLRWIVAHLLEETARHAGHADILRERLDGRTGR